MLLKQIPEQVSEQWDKFAPLLEMSLPPTVTGRRTRMANVLIAILLEKLDIWVYYENQVPVYVVATEVRTDKVVLGKDLLIYAFTAMRVIQPRQFVEGFETLNKYGKDRGCQSIIAYVEDERIEKFLVSNGARSNFKLAQMEIS